jgi:hypothetical protein
MYLHNAKYKSTVMKTGKKLWQYLMQFLDKECLCTLAYPTPLQVCFV